MTTDEKMIKNNVQKIGRLLRPLGFELENYQPHISGERQMKSLTKLVLIGRRKGQKVLIKASKVPTEKKRIELERNIRQELETLSTASNRILLPNEIYYGMKDGFSFFITEFINQPRIFIAHNLKKQFEMVQRALESHEVIDLMAFKNIVGNNPTPMPIYKFETYLRELKKQIDYVNKNFKNSTLIATLEKAQKIFTEKAGLISSFGSCLVHDDFWPHNFRINGGKLYFLDYTAMHFGNPYVAWARLLNYMAIHNPPLEKKIIGHFKNNRRKDDLECLRLFRIYKTVFLIMYYVKMSKKVSGKLLLLTRTRIDFWRNFLNGLLEKKSLTKSNLSKYLNLRDSLRSREEKKRQGEFARA